MSFGKRLRAILKEERYSQRQFAEMIGIPLKTLESYITEKREPGVKTAAKIMLHPSFSKYGTWLMTGETNPEAGQVSPAFSTQEQCGLIDGESRKQA